MSRKKHINIKIWRRRREKNEWQLIDTMYAVAIVRMRIELETKRNETKQKRHTHLLSLLWKCHSMEIDRSLIANWYFK